MLMWINNYMSMFSGAVIYYIWYFSRLGMDKIPMVSAGRLLLNECSMFRQWHSWKTTTQSIPTLVMFVDMILWERIDTSMHIYTPHNTSHKHHVLDLTTTTLNAKLSMTPYGYSSHYLYHLTNMTRTSLISPFNTLKHHTVVRNH